MADRGEERMVRAVSLVACALFAIARNKLGRKFRLSTQFCVKDSVRMLLLPLISKPKPML